MSHYCHECQRPVTSCECFEDTLVNRVFEELQQTPDKDILAGETADEVKQRAVERLDRARRAAAREQEQVEGGR